MSTEIPTHQTTKHTRKWYIENFGVDPFKLNLAFKEVPNPHYRSAAPMRLWEEEQVLPFKSEQNIQKHKVRSERMKKVWEEIKIEEEKAHSFIREIKERVPLNESESSRLEQLQERSEDLSNEISELHFDKMDYYGTSRADDLTEKQDELREKRGEINHEIDLVFAKAKTRYFASLGEEERRRLDEAYDRLNKYYARRRR